MTDYLCLWVRTNDLQVQQPPAIVPVARVEAVGVGRKPHKLCSTHRIARQRTIHRYAQQHGLIYGRGICQAAAFTAYVSAVKTSIHTFLKCKHAVSCNEQ